MYKQSTTLNLIYLG